MKPIALLSVLFCIMSLPSAVWGGDTKPQPEKPQPDETVAYKTVGDTTLSLHVFQPAKDATSPRPAIVFFFGGGWNGGSPSQFYGQARALADRGMVAFCAEYRVKSRNGTSPRECVADGKSAVRWLRQNADRLGIDPDRIVAAGGSAGGHVAASTATVDDFDESTDDESVSCRPNALVLFNPVYDNGPDGYGYSRVKEYWKEISPLHRIDKDVPPTIVFLGTKDKLIPVETAKQFQQKLNALDIENELHLYKGQPHGFFNRGKSYEDTLAKTVTFLAKLGYASN